MRARRLAACAGVLSALVAVSGCQAAPGASAPRYTPAPVPVVPSAPDHVNIDYAGDGSPAHTLDLYEPVNATTRRPVVIWVHGGAWLWGSKDMSLEGNSGFGAFRAMLQSRGYAVASVQYRFAKQAPFPGPVDDVRQAVAFLRDHAADFNLDPTRFVIAGESAGGNLAKLVAYTQGALPAPAREVDADTAAPAADPRIVTPSPAAASPLIKGVISFYGVSDLPRVADDRRRQGCKVVEHAPNSGEWVFVGGHPSGAAKKTAQAASPITYARTGVPTLFLHGTRDCVVPEEQSERMRDALIRAGISAELVTIPAGHADRQFYTDPELQDRLLKFLGERLA